MYCIFHTALKEGWQRGNIVREKAADKTFYMNLRIQQANGEAFVFTGEPGEDMRGHLIPGSRVSAASGGFGKLLLQEVEFDGYSFLFAIIDAQADTWFTVSSPEPVLLSHIILQGKWSCVLKPVDRFKLREGHFCLFADRYLHAGFYFAKGRIYKAITVHYPAAVFLQALRHYPSLQPYEEAILKHTPFNAGNRHPLHSNKALQCIHTLLHAPFSHPIKSFHTSLLNKLLLCLLRPLSHGYKTGVSLPPGHIENIYAAKALIDAHLPHHFRIADIARKTGVNELQLKQGFKAFFGQSLYHYYRAQTMLIAKKALEETYTPVKVIALRAGYKRPGSFSMAFKKFFGAPPGEVRKKFKV